MKNDAMILVALAIGAVVLMAMSKKPLLTEPVVIKDEETGEVSRSFNFSNLRITPQ